MTDDEAGQIVEAARTRWPEIAWTACDFAAHCGEDRPAHPLDLYLAGAAGHRLPAAWTVLEDEFGPRVRRVLLRQPIADYSVDDLWHETIARMMADCHHAPLLADGRSPAQIVSYRGRVPLMNYLIVIGRRLAICRDRKLTSERSHRPQSEEQTMEWIIDTQASPRTPSPTASCEEAEAIAHLREAISRAYATLTPEQCFLIAMVYRQGVRQKHAGAMLNWSEFKTSRALTAAMNRLRQALGELADDRWSAAFSEAWTTCIDEHWDLVQLQPTVSS